MAPKKKQEKMNLGEFLTNQSLGSWADEMDSQPIPAMGSGFGARDRGDRDGGERRAFTQPSWERSAGGNMEGRGGSSYDRPSYADREQLPLPSKPPYTAHLGNLAYDITSVDVETFLADCQVTSVRIVEDKLDRKPKGFGYVEFATLDGLKNALTKTESSFMGRNIKISIAEPPKDRPESSRDFSDWSRKGPLPELPQNTRQTSNRGFNRGGFDNMSDAGSERGGSKRPSFFEGDGRPRDLGNWERKGPLSPAPGAGPPVRDGGRLRQGSEQQERRRSPAWGEGRSEAGSRPPRREFEPRPPVERAPTAAEQDSQWRSKMKPDVSPAPTPEASAPTSPAVQAPKERPRLNLAKRTVSTAVEGDSPAAGASTDAKASPFGAARPTDTAARERAVEEKRELAIREKREADEKAREAKAAQEAAAKAARAERGPAEEDDKAATGNASRPQRDIRRPSRQQNGRPASKENGDAPPKERASFSILQREEGAEGAEAGDRDAVDAPANGVITSDKETKPQEVTKEVPIDAAEGAAQSTETSAETLEDDGWSTVASKAKGGRRGGARALAS